MTSIHVTRVYTGDDNQSHFEDIEVELNPQAVGQLSDAVPVTNLIFRETGGDYDLDFHNAPRRQYIVNLDGAVELTIGSGEKRVIGPGEVFLAEDTTGQGHISRAVNNQIRHSLFVTLD